MNTPWDLMLQFHSGHPLTYLLFLENASLHLHEFLLELLNTGGCEAYIHWTVQERKEFKIARPQRVAAMWGDRKNRKLLSDDKLTRALRYSIKKGKLEKTDSQLMLFRFTSN